MANENDYLDKELFKQVQHLEDLAAYNAHEVGTLEQIISNREAEIDRLKAENRFLREQIMPEFERANLLG